MEQETFVIGEYECIRYGAISEADTLLIQPVDEHDLKGIENELASIQKTTEQPFQLVSIKVKDWQTELTPWAAPAVFGKVPFGDGAAEMLRFISDELLPQMNARRVVLGGYSLAGLFALWASYNSDKFDGIAAASPSVWYPQWIEYAESHTPQTKAIYLSLGDREERAKNPVMARVGDCIRCQYELLEQQDIETQLEWNVGNHFVDADVRMAKGFAWVMNKLENP
ncbi:MAG: esterase [Prevotella sp.]|nr:esterase [Prevotella sp.]